MPRPRPLNPASLGSFVSNTRQLCFQHSAALFPTLGSFVSNTRQLCFQHSAATGIFRSQPLSVHMYVLYSATPTQPKDFCRFDRTMQPDCRRATQTSGEANIFLAKDLSFRDDNWMRVLDTDISSCSPVSTNCSACPPDPSMGRTEFFYLAL
ncbi:hypothetical protein N656DRAFT_465484 [Canariomyces notabilis]|uniref:Uncharacterized protein n=1 Tax=Canariomyces notabilis TaxID=2074819 RepID=A0AAN6QCN0_9PEZI|nr:hypothetical protein N656DRAFT_465484 [Canariomyces arenarius]